MSNRIEKQPCVLRCIAGETLLIPLRGKAADLDAIYVLNETAARLWEGLDRYSDLSSLTAYLAETFDGVTAAAAVQDVADFLDALAEAGLIRVTCASSQSLYQLT